ncbi:MAG: hypothetical protein IJW31_05290 [Lentisphaeria bacterium]|nr:hypothetical protein [Lentisphaeria bacterium]
MLRRFAPLHDGYILCHGDKDKPNSSFRAKRRIQNYNSNHRPHDLSTDFLKAGVEM